MSKNEDFNGPYLEKENEFLKNSFETVFRASKSCDRDQLVSAFQLTFNVANVATLKFTSYSMKLNLFTLNLSFKSKTFYSDALGTSLDFSNKCSPDRYFWEVCTFQSDGI